MMHKIFKRWSRPLKIERIFLCDALVEENLLLILSKNLIEPLYKSRIEKSSNPGKGNRKYRRTIIKSSLGKHFGLHPFTHPHINLLSTYYI